MSRLLPIDGRVKEATLARICPDTCAVIDPTPDEREPRDLTAYGDGARRLAWDLRLEVWSEHLELPADDPALLDPAKAFETWRRTAADLDAWHDGGERPPGQVRRHEPER